MTRKTRAEQGLPDRRFGNRTGQKPFEPTDKQREFVVLQAAFGMPYEKIGANKIFRSYYYPEGITEDTLKKYFQKELDRGLEYANAELGGVLFNEARKGNVRALEQWFDRRGGEKWKRKVAKELSGPNGGPITYSDMTDDELDARLNSLKNMENGDDSSQP